MQIWAEAGEGGAKEFAFLEEFAFLRAPGEAEDPGAHFGAEKFYGIQLEMKKSNFTDKPHPRRTTQVK